MYADNVSLVSLRRSTTRAPEPGALTTVSPPRTRPAPPCDQMRTVPEMRADIRTIGTNCHLAMGPLWYPRTTSTPGS